ncbi:RluA family pseudouridine synthase [Patescibacteria group bacterium]|nr:MAG: RluA family pseudouridine synthase [Patescibacteria group bacterium]
MSQAQRIPESAAGQRLDVALSQLLGQTRSQVQRMLKEQRVKVDSELRPAKWQVEGGEQITVTQPEPQVGFEAPDLTILYEDDDVMAIDKPAGLVVHDTETGRMQPTVAAFAAAQGVEDDDDDRQGIVHRLDKDTSGVMLLAKNPKAKAYLQQQFRERKVDKRYIALVRGRLNEDEATIKLPIGRNRTTPIKRAVLPHGRQAVTHYQVLERLAGACLVSIGLETGRTHQIRVHFAHLGHPVVGDTLYGEPTPGLNRQFLHAEQIEFVAPSGKTVKVSSPLPQELSDYLDALRNKV